MLCRQITHFIVRLLIAVCCYLDVTAGTISVDEKTFGFCRVCPRKRMQPSFICFLFAPYLLAICSTTQGLASDGVFIIVQRPLRGGTLLTTF